MNPFQSIFDTQKKFFVDELRTTSIKSRVQKLKKLKSWIKKNEEIICSEIKQDFNKGTEEVLLTEIKPILDEINHAVNHIHD